MKISILTIMPELFGDFLRSPVLSRAVRNGRLEVEIIDIRDFAPGSFRHIDDSPFGGGAGMVMRCQPVLDALRACREGGAPAVHRPVPDRRDVPPAGRGCGVPAEHLQDRPDVPPAGRERGVSAAVSTSVSREIPAVRTDMAAGTAASPADPLEISVKKKLRTVILTPAGTPYTQKKAHDFAGLDHLILICGHYEGMDARIYPHADELISIGDYILTGGELAAQIITDSVARLLPGSLREMSTREESFENGLLEYPQYTQPAVYEGEAVPEVLRSGDHARIRRWRLQQSLLLTKKMRPDLFASHTLTDEEQALLEEAGEQAPRSDIDPNNGEAE